MANSVSKGFGFGDLELQLNCLDEPVLAVSKNLLTVFGLHPRWESCALAIEGYKCVAREEHKKLLTSMILLSV